MQTTPITPDLVRGALELERTERGLLPHRLPERARRQAGGDAQLLSAQSQPSGVRLVFRTTASVVELDTLRSVTTYAGIPARPDCFYDLRVDGELVAQTTQPSGDVVEGDFATGRETLTRGEPGTARFVGLPARDKLVELWLPWNETVHLIALRTDALVSPAPVTRRTWVHHGSSISQGSNAASPSTTWPAVAARRADVELVNLGLAGSAVVDPFTARAIRDTPADALSVKLGINVVNHDAMRRRAFAPAVHGFLDTIRDGHPDTPLVLVSPLFCPIHEDTPGPGTFDVEALGQGLVRFLALGDPADVATGRLTLRVIREVLAEVVAQRGDPALAHLDGLELYGEPDHERLPLPDALHPSPEAHELIGERFAALAFGPGGPLSG
ncbi:lipase [Nocardioides anomalus]|uniref:Lipase n=1 Tax=Nocardioides anomalus TaxID=2712223 RepID=A0A6G6WDX3_9ACTN|nr:SGNH/GDSL hydrolase family protein [Nocardioides anomalus]QIG43528.1 lipase [Nocardioides anomalus]